MKQKLISVLLFLFTFSSGLIAQLEAPYLEWIQVIGHANVNETGRGADSTPDGGYVAGGTALWEGGTTDNLIVKFNSDGDSVWARSIGKQGNHEGTNSFIVLPDGRYVSAGYHTHMVNPPIAIMDTDALIMIADPNGNHLNTFYYGSDSKTETAMSICQALDSDFIFAGIVDDEESESRVDITICEVEYIENYSSIIIWKTIYNENSTQHPKCIYRTMNGGHITVGWDRKNDNNNQGLICKTLMSGAIERIRKVPSSNNDGQVELSGVTQLADSSIIITGLITYDQYDSNTDLLLIKYNASFTEQIWKKTFGDTDKHELGTSIDIMPDGGFVVGGSRNGDFWVIRFNKDGDILWEKTVGTDQNDYLYSIKLTDDNGFILCGVVSEKNNYYKTDMVVMKLGPEQEVDQPPILAAYIVDIEINEDSDDTSIDIANLFTDPDNDDSAITKTVQSVTNATLITATINGNLLTIDYLENQFGTATVTIRGTSNGLTVDEVFEVTVNPVNDAPTGGDSDVSTNEDVVYTFQESDFTYNDIENDNFAGIKIVSVETAGDLNYSGTDVAEDTDYPNVSSLEFIPETNGTGSPYAIFTYKVKDSAGAFSILNYTMTINVLEIDDPPTIAISLSDIEVDEDADNTVINITETFTDPDNDDSGISKTVQTISNPTLLTAAIVGNNLTLDYMENQFGTATITIRGTSNGQTIDDEFDVTVNPVNDAPQIFGLLNPPDNTTLDITVPIGDGNQKASNFSNDISEFSWEISIDADSNNIEYLVYYTYDGLNPILIANTELNSFDVPHDSLNKILTSQGINEGLCEVSGEWFVLATDRSDTTECTQKFSLTISNQHVGINSDEKIVDEFKLFDNYPNPFNPTTSIKYSIPENSDVNLTVYNSAGQIIDVLVNSKQVVGYYTVKWDASKAPSGVYFMKFNAGDFSDVKKCILVK